MLTTVILVALGQDSLNTYYSTYIIEALVVTELFVHLNAKARRGLSLVSVVFFVGFLAIMLQQVVKMLV
jgi:hypothetical protein